MDIRVFGANGPTGHHLVRQALAAGHDVTAFTRSTAFPIAHDRLRVHVGDALSPQDVSGAIAGGDAVLSALGVPFGKDEVETFSRGTRNMIDAMRAHGVRRLVVVSSSAVDADALRHDTGGGLVFEKLLKPYVIKKLGRTVYDDMRRMESAVRESGLEWVIARPSGLFEGERTAFHVEEGHCGYRFTSRADLAAFMLACASEDRWVGRAVAVATPSARIGLVEFMRKEALKK
ncbi:NmrA family transcriptional regulator [Actinorhabdospora filicis]|uniref:NmrA family transcriptional regulator n=1 Tax=Actinorhabdospora filicis TaxID=1785913 RepID=A0A9W6SJU6_9ACTN|nr:SDR family oxidoreductase [Actinorhabdospora filicis]GLZ76981.1 NmrA family transcriptional regulator [Actinorhabdospora filicis]